MEWRMEWRPIESAPKDRPILLGLGNIVGSGEYRPLHRHSYIKDFCFDGATLPSGATHWMPLPPPPAADAAVRGGDY